MKGLAALVFIAFAIVGTVLTLGCFMQPECAEAWGSLAAAWRDAL